MHTWILLGVLIGGAMFLPGIDALSLTLRNAEHPDSHWVGTALSTKADIASRTRTPQVLLVGGSNVNFGFSADLLQQEFSVPSTNLAVHAGLGRQYILWHAARQVKPGDLVVLALEYDLYGPPSGDPAERYQAFVYDRAYYEQLRRGDRWRILGSLAPTDWFALWSAKAKPPAASALFSMSLDARGDQVANGRAGVAFQKSRNKAETFDPAFSDDLREFAKAVRKRGAELVIVYPNLLDSAYRVRVTPPFLASIARSAAEANVPIAGRPEEGGFPERLVFDTQYHLNAEGTRLATLRLVRQLREAGIPLPGTSR